MLKFNRAGFLTHHVQDQKQFDDSQIYGRVLLQLVELSFTFRLVRFAEARQQALHTHVQIPLRGAGGLLCRIDPVSERISP